MGRPVGGEVIGGDALQLAMSVKVGDTLAVGDLCALDTTANFTVKDSVNDTAVFGKVMAIRGTGAAGVATADTVATVLVFGYRACVRIPTDAAIAVGVPIQTNGAGANNIETNGGTHNNTMVISNPGAAGDAYVLV